VGLCIVLVVEVSQSLKTPTLADLNEEQGPSREANNRSHDQ
jgi:hypothetical protein